MTYDGYMTALKELDVLALTELTHLPLDTLCLKEMVNRDPSVPVFDAMERFDWTTDFIVSNQHPS